MDPTTTATAVRTLIAILVFGTLALAPATSQADDAPNSVPEPILTESGLYTQPWFLEGSLDLTANIEAASLAGKRFAILWELEGCPYCKRTHLVNFADPAIVAYVEENFDVLQLDVRGSRLVNDFDGEELTERGLREKYGIRSTPTLQFFPESSDEIGGAGGQAAEVLRMPGYVPPQPFVAMFRFVRDEAYDELTLREYLEADDQN